MVPQAADRNSKPRNDEPDISSCRRDPVSSPRPSRRVSGWAAGLAVSLACALWLAGAPTVALAAAVDRLAVIYGPALGVPFHEPMGIAIDSRRGEVLVADTGEGRIEIYGLKGRLHAHFNHRVRTVDGRVLRGQPAQLLIDPAGRTLVVDKLASYVDVLDFRGRSFAHLDLARPAAGCPASSGVAGVTVAPSGDIFVASAGDSARVYRFDARYRPLGCWSMTEKGGALSGIRGIAALPDERLVVTFGANKTVVRIFQPTGEFVRGFGAHEVGPGNFSNPSGIAVTTDARIWGRDEIRQSVQVFDTTGARIWVTDTTGAFLGGLEGAHEFLYPSALATDGRELLAVAERVGNRYQLLKLR